MQYVPRASKKVPLLGERQKSLSRRFGLPAAYGDVRESLLRESITATLAALISLHHEEDPVGWRWPTHCFHSLHTVGTERIEPHTILCRNQALCQPGLQEDRFLSAQEALELCLDKFICQYVRSSAPSGVAKTHPRFPMRRDRFD